MAARKGTVVPPKHARKPPPVKKRRAEERDREFESVTVSLVGLPPHPAAASALGAEHLHPLLLALGHHALLGADGDWLVLYRVHVDRLGFQLTEVVRANSAGALLNALRERAVGMLGETLP